MTRGPMGVVECRAQHFCREAELLHTIPEIYLWVITASVVEMPLLIKSFLLLASCPCNSSWDTTIFFPLETHPIHLLLPRAAQFGGWLWGLRRSSWKASEARHQHPLLGESGRWAMVPGWEWWEGWHYVLWEQQFVLVAVEGTLQLVCVPPFFLPLRSSGEAYVLWNWKERIAWVTPVQETCSDLAFIHQRADAVTFTDTYWIRCVFLVKSL